MIVSLLCIFATGLNLGMAIWVKSRYDRHMREWRDLGRMEGFVEGVRSATEGKAVAEENVICMN